MKNILITGATGGIGRELVAKLSENSNYKLYLIDYDQTALDQMSRIYPNIQYTFDADFTDHKSVLTLARRISQIIPHLDILVNMAGIGIYKNLEEITDEDWFNSLSINVTSPFTLIRELVPIMNPQKSIVMNIGSNAGKIPLPGRVAYVTSKFALRGLSLTLSEEWRDSNKISTLISLGSVMTEFGKLNTEEKKRLQAEGKSYFTPEFVAGELIEILESEKIADEYELYP